MSNVVKKNLVQRMGMRDFSVQVNQGSIIYIPACNTGVWGCDDRDIRFVALLSSNAFVMTMQVAPAWFSCRLFLCWNKQNKGQAVGEDFDLRLFLCQYLFNTHTVLSIFIACVRVCASQLPESFYAFTLDLMTSIQHLWIHFSDSQSMQQSECFTKHNLQPR